MIDRVVRQPGALYLLLAAYFAVNFLLRLAMPASLELDEGQQLFLAQWLARGYDTQPPFYNWLQYGFVQLFGNSVAALSLLKNLMLFMSYVLFGLAANVVLRDRALALVATLGPITIPTVGFMAQRDLTHTVGALFAACMFAYFFFRTLKRPTALGYALTGVAIALGVLAKYNFVLLPVGAAAALLADSRLRARLFDPRILLTLAIAAVLVAPHALWFLNHIDEATDRTVGRMTADAEGRGLAQIGSGLLSLIIAIAAFGLPTLAVYAIAFGRALLRSWPSESEWTRLIGRMFVFFLIVLVLIVLSGASHLRDRWLLPMFFLLPIYISAKIEASSAGVPGATRRFVGVILAIMVIVPLLLVVRPLFPGALGYGKQNVPYGPAISAMLSEGKDRPSIILAGDQQLGGNIRLHGGGIPVTEPRYQEFERPFVFDATHPVLVVWRRLSKGEGRAAPKLPSKLRAWLDAKADTAGKEIEVRDIALPYHFGQDGDVYHFSYAWVYPAGGP